ncbi:DNA-binding XRE family transcriptional regulator [Streptomyces sp. PvR006]|uniref:helix-turn-helix domain-containing protein n=1 Tax=Streptomyces sp. PvR006 TaxID=2817860 RepID=UPI001AEB7B3F|nr:helix-turn-helix domain-containing protein [Streptomyces sp. PvR006]MBP2581852.1 DNA-binding XRE family transcriptional regulator [Streptomyces sp. PvR006]
MDLDWTRLGKALRDARRAAAVSLTQEEMAEEIGVGRSVIQLIEAGNEYKKPTPSIRAYAARVGWADGSIETVLAGGEATLKAAVAPAPETGPPADAGLPLRIVHELKGKGDLLDTAVIPLGDDASMVVVVKGKPGASLAEIERSLEAWRKAQGQLLEIDYRDGQGDAS